MNSLGTYATLGLTMLLWIAVVVGAIIVVKCVCKKDSEGQKKLMGCGALILIIILLFYLGLALLFIVLAVLAVRLKKEGVDVEVLTAMPNYPKMEVFEKYKDGSIREEEIEGV